MGFAGPGISGRGAVALQHGPGLPPGQTHEVGFVTAQGKPLMGEGVAELMRMEAREADLGAAAAQHHAQARVGQAAVLA